MPPIKNTKGTCKCVWGGRRWCSSVCVTCKVGHRNDSSKTLCKCEMFQFCQACDSVCPMKSVMYYWKVCDSVRPMNSVCYSWKACDSVCETNSVCYSWKACDSVCEMESVCYSWKACDLCCKSNSSVNSVSSFSREVMSSLWFMCSCATSAEQALAWGSQLLPMWVCILWFLLGFCRCSCAALTDTQVAGVCLWYL